MTPGRGHVTRALVARWPAVRFVPQRLVAPAMAALLTATAGGGVTTVLVRDRLPPAAAAAPSAQDGSVGGTSALAAGAAAAPGRPAAPVGSATPASPATSPVAAGAPAPPGAANLAPWPSPVAPLGRVLVPDLLVRLPSGATTAQLDALRALPGVAAVVTADTGAVKVDGANAEIWAVDPSAFRPWTPPPTAASDGLWGSVARGELVATFELAAARRLRLGESVPVVGPSVVPVRLGAQGALNLPGVDLLVDRSRASALGLRPAAALLVAAPGQDTAGLRRTVAGILGPEAALTSPAPPRAAARAGTNSGGKPRTYRELYHAAARTCRGLDWSILAAIGQVESNHGRNAGVSSAGAVGPMQFLPSTWAEYGVDGDGDGVADITNPYDAVFSAARYLCAAGIGAGTAQAVHDAVFAYNHAEWYVEEVVGLAAAYATKS